MSTQLDPVTGAPLLTPDLGNIDQLPYKVQPVPLADQTNQPQLGRTYLYPDDVPPVLANINAMNGTQPDQAQTVHTDGNHALKVAVSGGGGGTVIAPAAMFPDVTLFFETVAAHDQHRFSGGYTPAPLYGFSFLYTFNTGDPIPYPVSGYLGFGLINSLGSVSWPLYTDFVYIPDASTPELIKNQYTVMFPIPFDLTHLFMGSGTNGWWYPYCHNTTNADVIPGFQIFIGQT